MNGWVKLGRDWVDSPVFKNPNTWQVWSWCLMRANFKPSVVRFKEGEVSLKAGQFVTGRFTGSEACGMNQSTFRNQLALLKKLGYLDIKSDNKKSIITIMKWEEYQFLQQSEDSNQDNRRTTTGHRLRKEERKMQALDLEKFYNEQHKGKP